MTSGGAIVNAREAGTLLGKSGRTVRRMADAGVLPIAYKAPGRNGAYLFERSAVEKLRDRLAEGSEQ